jgi:hypothetical protein
MCVSKGEGERGGEEEGGRLSRWTEGMDRGKDERGKDERAY